MSSPRYLPFGDTALVIEFGKAISLEINQKVVALGKTLEEAKIEGIEEIVPTYRSLLVRYNPLKTTYEKLVFQIKDIESSPKLDIVRLDSREYTIPIVYGGEYGPDLEYVARYHGLTPKQVVELHSGKKYRVYMIGFIAGFPYLGVVPDEIATPRLEKPRLKVPAGSVGIAEKQTGVYPCEAPGGWRIIGRTPIKLFNSLQQPPTLLKAGDIVKFESISEEEFQILEEVTTKTGFLAFEGIGGNENF